MTDDHQYAQKLAELRDKKTWEPCRKILSVVTLAYDSLYLADVGTLLDPPEELSEESPEIVALHKFIRIESGIVSIDPSAKAYLSHDARDEIFSSGLSVANWTIFRQSVLALSTTLQRDIYSLGNPCLPRSEITVPEPDPLAGVRYSCVHWISHLCDAYGSNTHHTDQIEHGGELVTRFIQKTVLYWIEAMSLLDQLAFAAISLKSLENLLFTSKSNGGLLELVRDSYRFLLQNMPAIRHAPLQTYESALVSSPSQSLIRKLFEKEEPKWMKIKPILEGWAPCMLTLDGHGGEVNSIVFSHDSHRLASASDDNTVKVWETATGRLKRTLKDHTDRVRSVIFSHDSSLLASASNDNTVKIWETETGDLKHTLKDHITSVVFSHDSTFLASGSDDNTVKIWETATGRLKRTLEGHENGVLSVVFSHDSSLLASASYDNTVRIWEIETGDLKHPLEGHRDWVRSVAFSHDSRRLASASDDNTVKIWETATGRLERTLIGHENYVISVVFSHDSSLLASASNDNTVKIWEIETDKPERTLEGHTDWVRSVTFSHDSRRLASASDDNTVKIWETATGRLERTLEGHKNYVMSVVFSHDSTLLASASRDNTVKIWDGVRVSSDKTHGGHGDEVNSVIFSHDSAYIASASDDNTVKIWETKTGDPKHTLRGHENGVISVVFSHDSSLLASASYDNTVRIWEIETGDLKHPLKGHSDWVRSVAFSHDSRRLASASDDNTVKIWETATGRLERTLKGHENYVISVVFSHDSSLLASASYDNTVRIWEIETGDLKHPLKGHSDWVRSVAFSHDSRRLASASDDNTVKIWETATGRLERTLEGHENIVISVVFSHDSSLLASASNDNTVKIWETETGSLRRTFGGGVAIERMVFDNTGSYLDTDIGRIRIDANIEASSSSQAPDASDQQGQSDMYCLSSDRSWITWKGRNVLWIPPDRRPSISAVSVPSEASKTSTIVFGQRSGRIIFFHLLNSGPLPGASLIIARRCIECLRSERLEAEPLLIRDPKDRDSINETITTYISQHKFLKYAAGNWTKHARVADTDDSDLWDLAADICEPQSKRFQTWLYVFLHTREEVFPPLPQFPNKLSVALYLKLERLCLHLLKTPDVENLDGMRATLVHAAAENGYGLLLDSLITRNPRDLDTLLNNKEEAKQTPLHKAAKKGYKGIVEQLLIRSVRVDEKDERGRTPLHEAAANGHSEVVRLLLRKDAKVDEKDKEQRTPLHEAAARGRNKVIEILLGKGGLKVSQRVKEGKSHDTGDSSHEITVPASHEHEPATSTLSKASDDPGHPSPRRHTASIEAIDKERCTPLHLAAREGHLTTVSLLLSLGAIMEARDKNGQTPLYLGAKNGRLEVVQKLLSEGADSRTTDNEEQDIGTMLKEQGENTDEEARERSAQIKKIFEGLGRSRELYSQPITKSKEVDGQFNCAIIDFAPGICQRRGKHSEPSIHSVVRGEADIFKQGAEGVGLPYRWLHLPANNMRWIELLMLQYSKHMSRKRELVLRDERWMERLHSGRSNSVHARFMRPVCQEIIGIDKKDKDFVILMPYIHWEDAKTFDDMNSYAQGVIHQSDRPSSPEGKHKALIRAYMEQSDSCNTEQDHKKSVRRPIDQLHIRRSLDQYLYHALKDTKERDGSQLVSRMFKEQKLGKNVLIVVDQIWLWVLGGTVITAFPERWSKEEDKERPFSDATDVLENIIQDRPRIGKPHELAETIICKCLTSCLDPIINTDSDLHFMEIYEDEIGQTDREANRFREFRDAVRDEEKIIDGTTYDLNIREDVELLEKIKDIRDELHTLDVICCDQENVVNDFVKLFPESERPKRILEKYRADISRMDMHAKETYEALNHLLDLKQKHANVQEARSARRQADETAKQGDTLLVFTLVTIIFLPLSFMAAFFAIDIAEFPKQHGGLHLDFVSTIMFSVSAAVVLPLVVLAFNVRRLSTVWKRLASVVQPKATAAPPAQQEKKKSQPSLPSSVYYLLPARPLGEIWFAFDLIVHPWKKHEFLNTPQPKPTRNGGDTRRHFTLRPWLENTGHISAKLIRISALPFWLAILYIDIVLLVLFAGIGCLLFQDFPVHDLALALRGLWTSQGQDNEQLDRDKVAHAEEGKRTKQE